MVLIVASILIRDSYLRVMVMWHFVVATSINHDENNVALRYRDIVNLQGR